MPLESRVGVVQRVESQLDIRKTPDVPFIQDQAVLSKDQLGGLPFDLRIRKTDSGMITIERIGEKMRESDTPALRLYVIPTDALNTFIGMHQNEYIDPTFIFRNENLKDDNPNKKNPNEYHEFLRDYEIDNRLVGRLLAIDGGITNPISCRDLTIMVRKIETIVKDGQVHQFFRQTNIPTLASYRVTPEGIYRKYSDLVAVMDVGDTINLDLLFRDCDIARITEPPEKMLQVKEQDKDYRTESKKQLRILPGGNTIVISDLRDKAWGEQAPAATLFDILLRKDTGHFTFVFRRLYVEKTQLYRSVGPDGVFDGDVIHRFPERQLEFEVPIIPGKTYRFYQDASIPTMRRILCEMEIKDNSLTITRGVEPGKYELIGTYNGNPTGVLLFQDSREVALAAIKRQKEDEENRKKAKLEGNKKEIVKINRSQDTSSKIGSGFGEDLVHKKS